MQIRKGVLVLPLAVLLLASLSACASMASFTARNNSGPVRMELEDQEVRQLPASLAVRSTTFGQYGFTVTDDQAKVNGLLPLNLQKHRIFLDIFIFFPALLFNLQAACNNYVFDMETGEVICQHRGREVSSKANRVVLLTPSTVEPQKNGAVNIGPAASPK